MNGNKKGPTEKPSLRVAGSEAYPYKSMSYQYNCLKHRIQKRPTLQTYPYMKKINDSTYENNNDYAGIPSEPDKLAVEFAIQEHFLKQLFIEKDQRDLTKEKARELIRVFD